MRKSFAIVIAVLCIITSMSVFSASADTDFSTKIVITVEETTVSQSQPTTQPTTVNSKTDNVDLATSDTAESTDDLTAIATGQKILTVSLAALCVTAAVLAVALFKRKQTNKE